VLIIGRRHKALSVAGAVCPSSHTLTAGYHSLEATKLTIMTQPGFLPSTSSAKTKNRNLPPL